MERRVHTVNMRFLAVFILSLNFLLLLANLANAASPRKQAKITRLQHKTKNEGLTNQEIDTVQNLLQCFDMATDCILLNAIPFNRAIGRSVYACFEMCISLAQAQGTPCRGFQYDKHKFTCHFFTSGSTTAIRWPAYGYDYFELLPDCYTATSTSSTTTTPATTTTTTTSPPLSGVCAGDMQPLLQKAEGYKFQSDDVILVGGMSQAECLQLCTEDQDGRGEQYFCFSGSFERGSRMCTLSVTAPEPSGSGGTLVKQAGAVFFQKTCVSNSLARLCPSLMVERFPQMVLIGFQKLTITVPDYEMCIEMCIDSQRKFNFQCKSLMYYHATPNQEDNCLLNYEDHRAEPQLFVNEPSQKVDYISIGMCQRQLSLRAKNDHEPPILIIREIKTIMSM